MKKIDFKGKKQRRRHPVKSREDQDNFNFKNGELYSRMNFLTVLANEVSDKLTNLPCIYMKQMKKIKERNSLKLKKGYNNKICRKCFSLLSTSKQNGEISVNTIDGKLCYLQQCSICSFISKVNIQ